MQRAISFGSFGIEKQRALRWTAERLESDMSRDKAHRLAETKQGRTSKSSIFFHDHEHYRAGSSGVIRNSHAIVSRTNRIKILSRAKVDAATELLRPHLGRESFCQPFPVLQSFRVPLSPFFFLFFSFSFNESPIAVKTRVRYTHVFPVCEKKY